MIPKPTSPQFYKRPRQAVTTRQRRPPSWTGCRLLGFAALRSVTTGPGEKWAKPGQRPREVAPGRKALVRRRGARPAPARPAQPTAAPTGSRSLKMAPHLPPAPPPAGVPRGAEHSGSTAAPGRRPGKAEARGAGEGGRRGSAAGVTDSRGLPPPRARALAPSEAFPRPPWRGAVPGASGRLAVAVRVRGIIVGCGVGPDTHPRTPVNVTCLKCGVGVTVQRLRAAVPESPRPKPVVAVSLLKERGERADLAAPEGREARPCSSRWLVVTGSLRLALSHWGWGRASWVAFGGTKEPSSSCRHQAERWGWRSRGQKITARAGRAAAALCWQEPAFRSGWTTANVILS